jgi:hypothetical protein
LFGLPKAVHLEGYEEAFGVIFDELTKEEELTFNEFMTFFQVSRHNAAKKKPYKPATTSKPPKPGTTSKTTTTTSGLDDTSSAPVAPDKICLLLPK